MTDHNNTHNIHHGDDDYIRSTSSSIWSDMNYYITGTGNITHKNQSSFEEQGCDGDAAEVHQAHYTLCTKPNNGTKGGNIQRRCRSRFQYTPTTRRR